MAEVTMICVDNSAFMSPTYDGQGLMKAQSEAIEAYFREKLKEHPDNMVGFVTMGKLSFYCKPTRDPKCFSSTFKRLQFAGPLKLDDCLSMANHGLNSCSTLPSKRLVMFAGGLFHEPVSHMQYLATWFKRPNTAVDVVNFGMQVHYLIDPSGRKSMLLKAFVHALGDAGRYFCAPTGSPQSLSLNLSSSPIMPHAAVNPAPFDQDYEPLWIHHFVNPHNNDNNKKHKHMPKHHHQNRRVRVMEILEFDIYNY